MLSLPQIETLAARLRDAIIGQDEAVNVVAERLQHGELGLTRPGRPKASFLFLGPTGVGKTELSLQFTAELLGPGRLVRLDMSEYQTQDRLDLLLGTARESGRLADGYDHCEGMGTLLFDEIEKAHPRVLHVLLQILDAARVTTGGNRVLDFSSWYCVLTSNIGAARIVALHRSKYETMERLVRNDAQRELSPELFARLTETVVFNRLSYAAQGQIAAAMLEFELRTQSSRGFTITPDDGCIELIIRQGYDERLGARPMRRAVERLVRNALTKNLLEGGRGTGRLRVHPSGIALELLPTATAAQSLNCHGTAGPRSAA